MKTSEKISYEDLFSTDIDVIRRNIEFGTYKEVDPNIIVLANKKIESIIGKPSETLKQFTKFIYYEINDEQRKSIAKYLNIYYIDDDIEDLLHIKSKTMEQTEEMINWTETIYFAYYDINAGHV
jgi:hypothetical protein